uniref:Uncharacterized protein n=1 Tax=Anas platyrhynchos platyrhynchos TaxID=8840 RepID=A0A493TBF7_ANAPP
MATAFSPDGQAALRRALGPAPAPRGDIDGCYETGRAAAFVRGGGFREGRGGVALQFPDQLLQDAVAVAARLEAESGAEVSVLGDTTYGRWADNAGSPPPSNAGSPPSNAGCTPIA